MLKKTGKDARLKIIFPAILMVLCLMPAAGMCFEVTAHVDKNRISQDDSLILNVEVEGGKAELDLSMITDFKVVSRGTSSSVNYINGKLERKSSSQYVLIPLSKGQLKIPPIQATLDDQEKFSEAIIVHVSDQVVKPGEARDLFAISEVSKNALFAGEQAVYTLKFFTSKRLTGLGYESPPQFDGFSSRAFEKEKTYGQNLNGVQYQVTEVNYILSPQAVGSFKIDSVTLIANVMVKSRRDPRFDSFFNDSFFSSNSYKPVRVASNPVEIHVNPLPQYQGPGKFSGLVGQFEIDAVMDAADLKAGDSATLTLKISGSGNIMDAGLPEMKLDEQAFKTYDDNPVESISITPAGYQGYKVFKKAIVPVHPGKLIIPSVELIYFDVEIKKYHKILTDPIHLDVLPSGEQHQAGIPSSGTLSPPSIVKKEVRYENKDIFEIKEGLEVMEDYREIPFLLFVLCLMVPPFLFSGVKVFAALHKKDVPIKKQMAEKARQHLKRAAKTDRGDDDFLGHLYSALVALVLSKGNKKGESVTMEEAREILRDAEVKKDQAEEVIQLFETIDSVRFGGQKIDENRAASLLDETRKILKLICIAFFSLVVFWGHPQTVSANPAATFINGVNEYKAGNFETAASLFEAVAKSDIQNPYLFYNIGNAYLKAENIGLAILWYERAKRLMPSDPDLNFNLEHARSFVKDKDEDGMSVMEVLFFWGNLLQVKTIQVSAICICALFFAWASIRTLNRKRVFSGTGIALLLVLVFVMVIIGEHYYSSAARPGAVIIAEKAAVRSGVSDTATKLFSLHEGTKVIVKEQKNGYLKVVFSKGKSGWVKADQALII